VRPEFLTTPFRRSLLVAISILAATSPLHSQTNNVAMSNASNASSTSSQFQVGSSLEATADPTVPRPNTKPCVVTLLADQAFENFTNPTYTYTPPAECRGPWAKVVFTGDFSIQPGVQFDRTGQLFLGDVNIYFGTTAEPLQTQTDTWHVERDLTDYSALFKTPQTGYASLGNIIGEDGLNSIIFGTFKLEFYPANFINPAPRTADLVLPLPDNGNGSATLNATTPELTQTFTLPTNIESAYLDVIAQSQNEEEQWFLCLPNTVASSLGDCGNTAFRQVNISIDGAPAGIAPVFPWIYTGGVDPGLWIPIPGVQTLNLLPYRVDLTPFAGVLSNGQTHTVGVTVFNAFEYFSTVATLLVYEDHGSRKVTGEVTENTLKDPDPVVVNNVVVDSSGNASGSATVKSAQNFTIAGFVNTSHGRVSTKINEQVNFSNAQTVTSTATQFGQSAVQTSTVNAKTTTQTGPFSTVKETNVSYPFNIKYLETVQTNGNIDQTSTVSQNILRDETDTLDRFPIFHSSISNELTSADTATFVASPTGFSLGPNTGQSSKQTYIYDDSLGNCYSRTLTAADNKLTGVANQKECKPHFFF
jgi:Peptide N-acetyl-beta-D-glucosaminyl asparaginase amidase A